MCSSDLFSMSSPAMEQHRQIARAHLRQFFSSSEVSANSELWPAQEARFNDAPVPISRYFEYLAAEVIPSSTNIASPHCMGHMTGQVPGFLWPLAELLVALNQNLVKSDASRMLTVLERQALSMLHELVYERDQTFYDEHAQNRHSALGVMTTGGTLANLCALWLARNNSLGPAKGFRGIEAEGVSAAYTHYGCSKAVVLASNFAHYSIQKAVSILGLGGDSLISIPVDASGRMRLDELAKFTAECRRRNWRILAIVATAGTTDCGSIDNLPEIGALARAEGIHFHVDAAWGIALLFSRQHRHKLDGIDLADTVTADGHKQLFLPVGTSTLLFRDPAAASVIEKHSRYMLQECSEDLGKRSVEGSRPGTGLLLHAALHVIGKEGYGYLVDESVRKAQAMTQKLVEMEEFQLLLHPETNIILYRYVPGSLRRAAEWGTLTAQQNRWMNQLNQRIQETQRAEGRGFVSRTTIENVGSLPGEPVLALRAVVANPLLEERDIEYLLNDQIEIAARIEQLDAMGERTVPGAMAAS